jgi:CubicO group peptidase (beta-lactamase class C family)
MRSRLVAAIVAVALVSAVGTYTRPDLPLRAGTGTVAQTLCASVFVSGRDPEEVYRETLAPAFGQGLFARHLHWSVDRERREARADFLGLFTSVAVFRGQAGCLLWRGATPPPPEPELAPFPAALQPEIAGPDIVSNPRLTQALDRMFAEPASRPSRHVKAVVVVKDGRIIAERYASGIGINTPLLGYSVSKTVINALTGVLAGQGRLRVDAPAPIAIWAGDPRRAITLDNLLRMTSGLAIPEHDAGYDAVSRMLFTEPDMAAFAARAPLENPPGTVFAYTSGNTLLAARVVAETVGGTEATVLNFARSALFGPLGMRTAVIETDAAGTPVGSTFILASARDWARFGLLYLNDGVVNGHRLLPEGWVDYTRRATLDSDYGAGFMTNESPNSGAAGRVRAGMPEDGFFASGRLGQRIYIMPTQRLVVVRFGVTWMPEFDIASDIRFIREVITTSP